MARGLLAVPDGTDYLDGLTPATWAEHYPLLTPAACARIKYHVLMLRACTILGPEDFAFDARHRDDNGYWRYCLNAVARMA
jgi:hypothetical protein